jgi:hypothetical protein
MANQRKATKKSFGGYVDADLVEAIGKTGMDNTSFAEWAIIRGLLAEGRIAKSEVRKMLSDGRIKSETVLRLEKEGLLK